MINLKFDITIKDEGISPSVNGKVFNLVRMFNAHLERLQDAGMFQIVLTLATNASSSSFRIGSKQALRPASLGRATTSTM